MIVRNQAILKPMMGQVSQMGPQQIMPQPMMQGQGMQSPINLQSKMAGNRQQDVMPTGYNYRPQFDDAARAGAMTGQMVRQGQPSSQPIPVNLSGMQQQQPQYQQGQLTRQNMPMAQAGGSQNYGLAGFESAIGGGMNAGLNFAQQGSAGAMATLQGTRQDVLNQQNQAQNALNQSGTFSQIAARQGTNQGLGMINQGQQFANQSNAMGQNSLMQGLSDANQQLNNANQMLGLRAGQGMNALNQGYGQARGDLQGFAQGGAQAQQQQAALSGAMGPQAQQMAMNATLNSPEFEFLREQGNRAVMANAAATGGLGGGEVQRELARFGQGLAAQQFGAAFDRLGGVANRGLEAGGQMAQLGAQQGQTGASLLQQLGGQQADIFGRQGQNIMSTGMNSANLDQATGQLQANLAQQGAGIAQQGGQLQANLAQSTGQQQSGLAQNISGQLANLGGQAGYVMQQGGQFGANLLMTGAGQLAQGRQQAGRDLAEMLAGQSGAQSGLVNQQGQQVAGQVDQVTNNLANFLQNSGAMTANDQIRMAELLQALATQSAAGGSAAIGNAGNAQANAALAGAGNTSNLLGQLTGAFAMTGGFPKR